MSESTIKKKIFLAKLVDYVVFAAVAAFGLWGILYSDKPVMISAIALAGLFVVNRLGNYTMTKVTILQQELAKVEREKTRAI